VVTKETEKDKDKKGGSGKTWAGQRYVAKNLNQRQETKRRKKKWKFGGENHEPFRWRGKSGAKRLGGESLIWGKKKKKHKKNPGRVSSWACDRPSGSTPAKRFERKHHAEKNLGGERDKK